MVQSPETDWRITLGRPVEDEPFYQRHHDGGEFHGRVRGRGGVCVPRPNGSAGLESFGAHGDSPHPLETRGG